MAMDQDYQDHLHTWIAFTRLMKQTVIAIVIVLVLMAIFLL